jgi:hypothetical protein
MINTHIEQKEQFQTIHTRPVLEEIVPAWFIVFIWFFGLSGLYFLPKIIDQIFPLLHLIDIESHAQLIFAFKIFHVLIAVCCFGMLLWIVWHKVKLPLSKQLIPLILFMILFGLRFLYGGFFNENNRIDDNTIGEIIRAIIHLSVLFIFMFFFSYGLPNRLQKATFWSCFFLTFGMCLFYFIFWHKQILSGETSYGYHFWSTHLGPIATISLYSPSLSASGCITAILVLWASFKKWIKPVIFIPVFIPGITILFFGVSRGYVCTYFILITIIFIVEWIKKRRNYWKYFIFVSLTTIIILLFVGHNAKLSLTTRLRKTKSEIVLTQKYIEEKYTPITITPDFSNGNNNNNNNNNSSTINENKLDVTQNMKLPKKNIDYYGRGRIWLDTIDKIIYYPITGYGASPYKMEKDTKWRRPHNLILEAFLQTGVIGGVIFLIIILIGFKDAFICLIRDTDCGWLSIIFLLITFYSFIDCVLISNYMFWFSLIGLRISVSQLNKEESVIKNTVLQ